MNLRNYQMALMKEKLKMNVKIEDNVDYVIMNLTNYVINVLSIFLMVNLIFNLGVNHVRLIMGIYLKIYIVLF